MKIVLDTNALLSATLWDGSSAQKLLYDLIEQNAEIYISKEILREYQKILKRDFKYNKEETSRITQKILLFAKIIKSNKKIRIVEEDPDDDKIIECAFAAKAEHIVTYDKHLLNIKEYKSIKIVTPEELKKCL